VGDKKTGRLGRLDDKKTGRICEWETRRLGDKKTGRLRDKKKKDDQFDLFINFKLLTSYPSPSLLNSSTFQLLNYNNLSTIKVLYSLIHYIFLFIKSL